MVERASLERMYGGNPIGGSNPPLSANTKYARESVFCLHIELFLPVFGSAWMVFAIADTLTL